MNNNSSDLYKKAVAYATLPAPYYFWLFFALAILSLIETTLATGTPLYIVSKISTFLMLVWEGIVGTLLYSKLHENKSTKPYLFLAALVPIAVNQIISSILSANISSSYWNGESPNAQILMYSNFLNVVSAVAFLYVPYFLSKNLIAVEGNTDKIDNKTFFAFFIPSLGTWHLQPRLSKVFFPQRTVATYSSKATKLAILSFIIYLFISTGIIMAKTQENLRNHPRNSVNTRTITN